MTWEIGVAWFHYISIMVMAACLISEHLLLKPDVTVPQARTLQALDAVYGISAGVVIATGVARIFLEKGAYYYLHHFAFHALIGIFVVVGLLSIYPTVIILRWRAETRADRAPVIAPGQFKAMQMVMRLEIVLLMLAPLFAAWMAHKAY